jgi:hypothetical protein
MVIAGGCYDFNILIELLEKGIKIVISFSKNP